MSFFAARLGLRIGSSLLLGTDRQQVGRSAAKALKGLGLMATIDTREVDRMLNRLARDMPKVAASALNSTAYQLAREDWPTIAESQLDRPTPFTQKGGRYVKATPSRLTATVHLAPVQERYLLKQITGGPGSVKKAVPAAIPLNQYGNIPGLRGGKKLRALLARRDHFRATIRGIDAIWKRKGRSLVAVVTFPEPHRVRYQKRLDFVGAMHEGVRRRLRPAADKALRRAIAKANARG